MSPRSVVRVVTVSSVLAISSSLGSAQTAGGTPARPPTGANPTTGTGSNGATPPTTGITTGTSKTTTPGYSPPIYINGRVTLEDGSPPPQPATIERVCYGNSRAEGYTDSQGNFGIELGNESSVFQDASETSTRSSLPGGSSTGSLGGTSGGMGSAAGPTGAVGKYQGCELRAKLPGYRSQTLSLANRRPLDDPNIGTILLHREGAGETGSTVSANSLAAPKEARKAYERGLQASRKNKIEDASKEFEKAVELYPAHAEAWYELGRIQIGRGQSDTARESFGSSIKSDPKFISPYVQLSLISMREKNWPELAEITDRAMRLDSFDYPQLFLFNAVANYNMHKFELADRSIKQAARLDTQHRFAEIPRLTGLLALLRKDYALAADNFRSYLKLVPDAEDAGTVRTQLQELERITAQSSVSAPKEK
ncbi:MAG TPA: tetratricopeptide repeat protein [Candidatus Sulfopaludibacter sp.]|jgi:tetratricopeptide (TPR) repeat protein|nr:tetratricopeptide repeat protein [Candidatus Sulfopaludibacter sp.]